IPSFLGILAEVLSQCGQFTEALATVAEALALAERTGERCHEAELHRLQGELLWQQAGGVSAAAAAGGWFQRALGVAQREGAKTFELRAALSLARLGQQQGSLAAVKGLADVYSWFTEGHDTADLREARAFLDSVGAAPQLETGDKRGP